jgi:hypothetical protein
MSCLPIIERELRVRARSRASYWTRFAVALGGILLCLPSLIWSGPFGTPVMRGRVLFNEILSAAFLLSCGACLLTADVISSERREGTLGLLLLTPVKAFDVLLGKLGSTGLTSLCALVACLPMLMIPLLLGGVTGGEAFRKGLVLPDTMFLALAAGLWASAGGGEWLKTTRTALLLVATLVLAPGLAGLVFGHGGGAGGAVGLLSPLGAIAAAGDASYKGSAADYWISLLLVQAVGWALLVNAGIRLRNGWREERGEIEAPAPASVEEHEAEAVHSPRRPLGDDANPIAWLLQRQRGIQALLWAGALIGLHQYGLSSLLWFGLSRAGLRSLVPSSYWSVAWPLSLATGALEGALFAWAASRFFVEARRTGELELLLTTPFGAREIVSTQWEVLKRRFRWPMVVLLAPALLQAGVFLQRGFGYPDWYRLQYATSMLISCVNIFFGVGALCWVGLWFGLRAGGQARAIVWTVSLVKGLPCLIFVLCWVVFSVLSLSAGGRNSPLFSVAVGRNFLPLWVVTSLPQVLNLVCYLGLIRLARQRLLGEWAGAEVMKFDLRQFTSSAARDAVAVFRKARHWTPL